MEFGFIIIIIRSFMSCFLEGKKWNCGMGFLFRARGGSCYTYELAFSGW